MIMKVFGIKLSNFILHIMPWKSTDTMKIKTRQISGNECLLGLTGEALPSSKLRLASAKDIYWLQSTFLVRL